MFRITIVCCVFCASAVINAQEAPPKAPAAARVGDRTASGGVIVTGSDSVLIEGQPAAREGDLTTNPTIGTVPGVGGAIRKDGQAGAGDQIVTGASSVVIGSNVLINGQSAATAAPTPKPMNVPDPASAREQAVSAVIGAQNLAIATPLMEVVSPEEAGMSAAKLAKVDSAMNESVEQKQIAGGVVMVARYGNLCFSSLTDNETSPLVNRWRTIPSVSAAIGAQNLAIATPLMEVVSPEEAGMSAAKLAKVDSAMNESVEQKQIAGGVVMVARHGKIVFFKSYGQRDIAAGKPMEKKLETR